MQRSHRGGRKTTTNRVIASTTPDHGKQGFDYRAAISAQSVGSRHIRMHLLTSPPGAKANTDLHQNHETAIYLLSGEAGMWHGPELVSHLEVSAGDFIYIPAGVPHQPYNQSTTEPAVVVLARTDPNEQESVVLLPELDEIHR